MNRRPIVILKTGEALPAVKAIYGDFETWIAKGMGQRIEKIDVADVYQGTALPEAESIAGVVVTGSPAMVTERHEWSERSARWVADLVRRDAVPVLGICYGHQLMAHGLGGEVGPNPRGREMGTFPMTVGSESQSSPLGPLFEAGVFPAHLSHVESVLRLPSGARALATTALEPHAVVQFGPRQWGVQYHPEFDGPIMRGYVEARREILGAEGINADETIDAVVETPELSSILVRFASFVARS